jgi:hypothetical protein
MGGKRDSGGLDRETGAADEGGTAGEVETVDGDGTGD